MCIHEEFVFRSDKGQIILGKTTTGREFLSTAEAQRAFHFPENDREKRKAKSYLKRRVKVKAKRNRTIASAKQELGQYSPTLYDATERWSVNDALIALRDEYSVSTDKPGRRIYLRCIYYMKRLEKYI